MKTSRWGRALVSLLAVAVLGGRALFAQDREKSLSLFPILMFDTDIGFGYGGRAKFVSYLAKKESFDFIAFNSTKGERWFVFTFSLPDFELRQGKAYGLSFDLKAEYDRFLNYGYYGLGPDALRDDRTDLTHETTNLNLCFGHGFSPRVVLEVSYVFRWVRYSGLKEGPLEDELLPLVEGGARFAPFVSFTLRYDTSDSQIHPRRGFRLIVQDDLSAGFLGSRDSSFNRITVDFRKYQRVFGEEDVFAVRALVQYVGGDDILLFDHASLGGGGTLSAMRGYALNRFLDRGKFLVNAEYRFPILWRVGGNLFLDAGTVWPSLKDIDLGKSVFDGGAGLRFYAPDFVARVDVAFGNEGVGLYFNFGHIF
jgi:outer membrane protein assembly factor BamA